MSEHRQDWIVEVDRSHFREERVLRFLEETTEHEVAFYCHKCNMWLRNASTVISHFMDTNTCKDHRFLTNNGYLHYRNQEMFEKWAYALPSASNAFDWLHKLDTPILCPQCHCLFEAPIYLQEHLDRGCEPFPVQALDFDLVNHKLRLSKTYSKEITLWRWIETPNPSPRKIRAISNRIRFTYSVVLNDWITKQASFVWFRKLCRATNVEFLGEFKAIVLPWLGVKVLNCEDR